MDPSAVERGNLTRVQPARGGQSSEMAATRTTRRWSQLPVLRTYPAAPRERRELNALATAH